MHRCTRFGPTGAGFNKGSPGCNTNLAALLYLVVCQMVALQNNLDRYSICYFHDASYVVLNVLKPARTQQPHIDDHIQFIAAHFDQLFRFGHLNGGGSTPGRKPDHPTQVDPGFTLQ